MADNYLEKRYDEVFGSGKKSVKRIGHTLDELLLRNRSTRGYNGAYVVKRAELERIVGVCGKIASARNQQALRFRLVTKDDGAERVLPLVKMGAALPELHLPFPGTEPNAFIICCSKEAENAMVDIDLGIAAQSMLLKAAEMGLNGLIIAAFDHVKLCEAFALPYKPLLVIAIGKGAERHELVPIDEGESQTYYRENGTHYIPKVKTAQLILD